MELEKSWREKTEVMSTILKMLMAQAGMCKATLINCKILSDYKSSKEKGFREFFSVLIVSSYV